MFENGNQPPKRHLPRGEKPVLLETNLAKKKKMVKIPKL